MSLSRYGIARCLWVAMLAGVVMLPTFTVSRGNTQTQPRSRLFPETGKIVKGRFLEYWETQGGLPRQGYPITDELLERSATDGKLYTVQYFERGVFEHHPENRAPYDVLLTLLGAYEYKKRHPGGATGQAPNSSPGSLLFPDTGKRLGGPFLRYWQSNGGLPQYGYPISDEFLERSDLDGKQYMVQYFERAVFELHPEHAGTSHEVLLSHLGRFRFHEVYITMLPAVPLHSSNVQQAAPRLSESYMVWYESLPPSPDLPYSEVFALDLKSNKRTHVTANRPDSKTVPHVSGSVVVWNELVACPKCNTDVIARDLATGETFAIATGPANQRLAGISGSTVLWTDSLTTQDANGRYQTSFKLLSKQVGSDTLEEIPIGAYAYHAQISEEYIVWSEAFSFDTCIRTPFRRCVFAFDRTTRSVKSVATLHVDTFGVTTLRYVLAGRRLLIVESLVVETDYSERCPCAYYIIDLDSGRRTDLPDFGSLYMPSPAMHGDIIVWEKYSYRDGIVGGLIESTIWGLDLGAGDHKEPKQHLLVIGNGHPQRPAIWGDWIAWHHGGRIGLMPLSALFATAEDREKMLP